MPFRNVDHDNAAALKAVSFILDTPVAELAGYVVVGVHYDNTLELSGNQAHLKGMAAILAQGVANIMYDVADSIPLEEVT